MTLVATRRWWILVAFLGGFYVQNIILLYKIVPKADLSLSKVKPSIPELKSWENNNALPESEEFILNILVDGNGSCPDNCVFIHKFLPPWVKFRYVFFANKESDATAISTSINGTGTKQQYHRGLVEALERQNGHVLIVARYHVTQIAKWARQYKDTSTEQISVGLFLMGDELLLRHNKLVTENLYTNFDYVLRNYFFNQSEIGDIPLRFLGNATCGKSLPLPSTSGPKWGLHWMFLQPHESHVLLDRPAQSIEPAHLRPKNCSFSGWIGGTRLSKEDRAQVRKLSFRTFSDLQCNIALSGKFGANKFNHSKVWYLNEDLAKSKIGLNPRGVHPECHRLPEMLKLGTVPAMTKQDYMEFVHEPIPGIIEDSWMEVFLKMRFYLSESGINELSALSFRSAFWMEKLESCMRNDIEIILAGAFGVNV